MVFVSLISYNDIVTKNTHGDIMREIILADNAGFCFGVSRAVKEAFTLGEKGKKVFTFGELIHNRDVVEKLKDSNVEVLENDPGEALKKDDTVIIRSHGLSEENVKKLKASSDNVVDLTCPYVSNIHRIVREHADLGYTVVILGDKNHPEVMGINGWCYNKAIIVRNGSEDFRVPLKVCAVAQTTEKLENWVSLITKLSAEAKEIRAFNTICAATGLRQNSTEELSKKVEAMVVIGGKHSSNTTKLYEISRNNCINTYFVENAEELKQYTEELKKYSRIGVTAGASTPDWIIKEAMELL